MQNASSSADALTARTEAELATVLEALGLEQVLQDGLGHDTDGALLQERLKRWR